MSRTFRRDEYGRKAQDSRRAKKREKNKNHWNILQKQFEENRKNKESGKPSFNRNYNDNDLDY